MSAEPDVTEALIKAIIDHAAESGIVDPAEEMLGDFVVVCHWQHIEDDGCARYSFAFPRDSLPDHIVRGLLAEGVRLLDGINDEADD
jgi:hypothetical protein